MCVLRPPYVPPVTADPLGLHHREVVPDDLVVVDDAPESLTVRRAMFFEPPSQDAGMLHLSCEDAIHAIPWDRPMPSADQLDLLVDFLNGLIRSAYRAGRTDGQATVKLSHRLEEVRRSAQQESANLRAGIF